MWKQGEVLDGFKNDFSYKTENLEGAVLKYMLQKIFTRQISRRTVKETGFWNMQKMLWWQH